MGVELQINGRMRTLTAADGATLQDVIAELELRGDRIAAELNDHIVPRAAWDTRVVQNGDKLEIVHFVGGGTGLFSKLCC